ncbi:MAG: hypothetical protein FWD34_00480 [Oscillospiraceae bacterium]|nr:hypothetical protein [Oscillospiraceae bacterium]
MAREYKALFEISSPGSQEDFITKVTAKEQVKRRPNFAVAAIPAAALCAVLAVVVFWNGSGFENIGGFAGSSTEASGVEATSDNDTAEAYEIKLAPEFMNIGKYIHISGDEDEFIEVLEDGTIYVNGAFAYFSVESGPVVTTYLPVIEFIDENTIHIEKFMDGTVGDQVQVYKFVG